MAIKDIRKGLKKTIIETKDAVKNTADSIKDAAKYIKVPELKADQFLKKKVPLPAKQEEESKTLDLQTVSTKSALKIIYFLMAADAEVYHSEDETFDTIGLNLDPNFMDIKEDLISECQNQLNKVIDPEDYDDVVIEGVADALLTSVSTEDSFITPKLLVWNLLTIAHSDEKYHARERKIIKYIVRKLNIDKDIFLEMEHSFLTLSDLEKELNWIKTTDRPYLKIEAMVNEIADRKNVVFESVKDLITL